MKQPQSFWFVFFPIATVGLFACFFFSTSASATLGPILDTEKEYDLQIISVYDDDIASHSSQPINGSGFLIEHALNRKNSRYFVLTAAHVAQGSVGTARPPQVVLDGRQLKVLGWLADSRHDIEVIEVQKPASPALGKVMRDDASGLRIETSFDRFDPLSKRLYHSEVDRRFNVFTFGLSPYGDLSHFVLLPKGQTDTGTEFESLRTQGSEYKSRFRFSAFGGLIHTRAVIAPGMSGSPLFVRENQSGRMVDALLGLSLQYERDGINSFFAPTKMIQTVLRSYIHENKRGFIGETRWKMRNANLYRDFGGGTTEIPIVQLPAGNKHRGDGGNKHRGDGGDTSVAANESRDLPSGMQYLGQNVIAFKATPRVGGAPVFIEANPAALDFIEMMSHLYQIDPVPAINPPFIEMLLAHYVALNPEGRLPFGLRYNNTPVEFSLVMHEDRAEAKFAGPGLNEPLSFMLGSNGARIDEMPSKSVVAFDPVIHLRSEVSGQAYSVDLRQLFFADLSLLDTTGQDLPTAIHQYFFSGAKMVVRSNQPKHPYRVIHFK